MSLCLIGLKIPYRVNNKTLMNDLEREKQVADFTNELHYCKRSLHPLPFQPSPRSCADGRPPPSLLVGDSVTAPSLCHGDTEGPAFRGCSRLCTIVGGRGQVSSGIVVQVHHSTASRGPGRCWVSPTHTRKEARSSPNETALGRQWIAKARQRPRK